MNKASQLKVAYFTWTCTQIQITLLPNEYKGVVNSSGLVVYKGSMQEIKVELESKDSK